MIRKFLIFPKKSFFSAALGTMIEYYDYALFGIFLPILAPLFFSAPTTHQALVKGYYVLLITMIARPFGGIIFGYIGDCMGRRKALLSSMLGIALATLAIGLVPTYQTIGLGSIIIIIIAKSIQMICFGGEFNGAGIYVIEHSENNESLMSSLLTATTLFGSLVASLMGIVLTYSFVPAWGWRIAFILGGAVGLVGVFFRKNLLESPFFQPADSTNQGLKSMLRLFPQELIAGIFIGGFSTLPFTTIITFINPVLVTKGYLTNHQFMILQTFLILIAIILLIAIGLMSNQKSMTRFMKMGCLSFMLLSYPLLLLIDQGFWVLTVLSQILFIFCNEIFLAPCHVYLKNLFAMQYRYRGAAISFCVGMSLIGGLTPIIENYLFQLTGYFAAISLWLIFISFGTFLAIENVRRKQEKLIAFQPI